MFKLVLVYMLLDPQGQLVQERKEYHFTKVGECEDMVETLRKITPRPFRYRCERAV
jgi:hypothetical protein